MEKIIGIEKPAGKVRKYIFWKISLNGIFFLWTLRFHEIFCMKCQLRPSIKIRVYRFRNHDQKMENYLLNIFFWKIIVKWQQLWDFNNFSAKLLRIVDTIFRLRTWYPAYTKNSGSLFTDHNLRLNTRMIAHCPKLNMIEEK